MHLAFLRSQYSDKAYVGCGVRLFLGRFTWQAWYVRSNIESMSLPLAWGSCRDALASATKLCCLTGSDRKWVAAAALGEDDVLEPFGILGSGTVRVMGRCLMPLSDTIGASCSTLVQRRGTLHGMRSSA